MADALVEATANVPIRPLHKMTKDQVLKELPPNGFKLVGQFEKLVGTAYGELDPRDPHNRIIQDIALAPRNAKGMVQYSMDVYIIKPINMMAAIATVNMPALRWSILPRPRTPFSCR